MFGVGGGVGNHTSVVSTLLKNIISDEISCYVVVYYPSQIIFSDNILSGVTKSRPVTSQSIPVYTDQMTRTG